MILAKRPVQEAITDVYRVHTVRATLDQAIGKPACAGSKIQGDHTGGVDHEFGQRVRELQSTPTREFELDCPPGLGRLLYQLDALRRSPHRP